MPAQTWRPAMARDTAKAEEKIMMVSGYPDAW
jgi:hypothetical protein